MYSSLETAERFIWLTSVEVVGDFTVRIGFSNGLSFVTDLNGWFVGGDNANVSAQDFAQVRLDRDSDTLLWRNGLHLHGEELYERQLSAS